MDLRAFVPECIVACISAEEKNYLEDVFRRFNGYPSLQQVWQLMDEAWISSGCDPDCMDDRIVAYYRHPVWVLNGLFIEQHEESLANRRAFTDWVVRQTPVRVADFGGGFGGLARFIGAALPSAQVEVVEPHPHPAAIALAENTPNVRYVPALEGEYDILIATDVFEHVPDPLGLCAETAAHLKIGGRFLIANCFFPVIKCHLPANFYFSYGWDIALQKMGLTPEEKVLYGRAYRRSGILDLSAARLVAERARRIYPFVRNLPKGQTRIGALVLKLSCFFA